MSKSFYCELLRRIKLNIFYLNYATNSNVKRSRYEMIDQYGAAYPLMQPLFKGTADYRLQFALNCKNYSPYT